MATTPSMTLRPGERASIRLPWRGSPGANYEWLKEVCGSRTRPEYDTASKSFRVARPHAQHVLDALVAEYGKVILGQYGDAATTCVEQCWNAKPENAIDCVCGCAGTNHGTGTPLGTEVQVGLSVEHTQVRAVYEVTAAGRHLIDISEA